MAPVLTLEVEMQVEYRIRTIVFAIVIFAVLVAFSGPIAGPADAAEKTNIKLELDMDLNGRPVIKVTPRDAKIWRNKPNKPKKVYWYVYQNYTSFDELYWEFRYEPSKGGGTANYFGDVDIKCGEDDIKVQPDKTPDVANAEWPYSITVYGCVDGAKAQKITTVDPRIVWKD